ncbi:partitioning defective 3 homolog isoform X10 [Palaemon carinicauda]|uniref:partitioning defective 3 homolog isoform X10 n=1 Tax=Palaemon carinicauda TaxID=392227 RepID=UPI0035B6236B
MRMRSRSIAGPPSSSCNNINYNNNNNNNKDGSGGGGSCSSSKSVLNIPGELKLHYSEVVSVAEKLTRLFSRTHTYHVHRRHKTLTQEPSNSWVTVHNLKQLDGGILDPDDRLNDVADDREQIIAIYDEQAHHHQGGDGTSASSDSENPSPDIFQGIEHKFSPFTRNDIEITGEELSATPPPLHVRRGSEPALNRLSPIPPANIPPDPTKRWSAAPIIEDQNAPPSSTPMKPVDGHSSYEDDCVFVADPGERGEGSGEEKTPSSSSSSSHHSATAFSRFSRDNNRCSVQVLSDNPAMVRWADAADKAMVASEGRRREPLGGSASSPLHSRDPSHDDSNTCILVVLSNDRGPLGIHVIPSTDGRGVDQGLLVEGVEPDGRIARDGRIEVHDRIIEINGKTLNNITFQRAQEIFKEAMQSPELRLRVLKRPDYRDINHRHQSSYGLSNELVEGEERFVGGAKVASVTSTRKVPPSSLSSRTQAVILQCNTRKLGRKVTVHLTKGPHGLGFSITTRDNPAGGEAPIYIKNILPKGAAIEDGTLRIGDRLLEVNGVEVTGRSQSEVAGLLRQIPIGGTATLTVSRQDQRNGEVPNNSADSFSETEKPSSPKLPRQLVCFHPQDSLSFFRQPADKAAEDSLMFPWKQREILMFEIPVHDSERAGLGVSVKGKTSSGPNGSVDLGIFVKNVIHGGAASRDGRLFQNDQLVNINGHSLLGKPNSEAMKTLRTAMHQEGPTPGMISLTVARRTDSSRERSSPSSANRSGRDSANSLLTNSSGTETLGGAKSSPATPTPDHSGLTDVSDSTLTTGMNKYDSGRHVVDGIEFAHPDTLDVRNPVIQRLTGNNGALRNESYYKATHDTWNTSQLQHFVMRGEHETLSTGNHIMNPLGSPTVNLPSGNILIIHDDPTTTHLAGQMSRSEGPGASSGSYSDRPSQSDDAYMSQTSLEENAAGFSRDQFGRQSMSEKRHATLDAKNTDTYQRNKKAREEREKQKQMMLAQEKLAASQGLGCLSSEGDVREELTPGSREVGIDVPLNNDPPVLRHQSEPPPKSSAKISSAPGTPSIQLKNMSKGSTLPSNLYKKGKHAGNNNHSYSKSLMRQKKQIDKNSCHGGSETVGEHTGKGAPRTQWSGYPRGPFSPVSRSLERHYCRSNQQRTTFGQDLSAMISNWAARNRDLLSRDPTMGVMVRASSDESLASQTHQRTNHAHQPSSHEHNPSQDALRSRLDVGPGLGMKKSSSLESLQTMVQELALEEEGQRMGGSGRVPRGRGCNESFRAAVDRSYDVPLSGLHNKMETLAEEESESSGSGFGRGNSRQSSVNSAVDDKLMKKVGKKKPGIFKGLGSMFRFGKHRKSIDNSTGLPLKNEDVKGEVDKAEMERMAAARRQQQEDHDRMQEQYRRMIETTARTSQQQQHQQSQIRGEEGEPSRSERMHQLRAEHQRRHAQRNRTYPTDDIEEQYESAIRQVLGERGDSEADKANNNTLNANETQSQRLDPVPSEPKPEIRHMRSHSYDLYGESVGRPGSRTGYADPHKFSHYVNYEQIQQHLRKNKEQERLKKLANQQYKDFKDKQTRRLQEGNHGNLLHKLEETFIHESVLASREAREYQSQRGPRESAREHQHRPVSNYYEYESVQAIISHAQDNSSTSLPRRHHPPPPGPPPPAAAVAAAKNNVNNNMPSNPVFPNASQSHPASMYKQTSGSSMHGNQTIRGGQTMNPSQSAIHISQRGGSSENPRDHLRDLPHMEGIYGSSYRPASHFTGPHHKMPPPPSHHHTTTLTVPGSKV